MKPFEVYYQAPFGSASEPSWCAVMSYQYGDEGQAFAYSRGTQYGVAHAPYPSYPNQLLAPYNSPSAETSGSVNQPYSSSFGHPSNHALPATDYHYSPHYAHSRCVASPRYFPVQELFREVEIEGQDSCNERTVLSEPIVPPLEGFPDVRCFDQMMKK